MKKFLGLLLIISLAIVVESRPDASNRESQDHDFSPKKDSPKTDPPSQEKDENDLHDMTWGQWTMLSIGMASIIIALLIVCFHRRRAFRLRRMSQFPMSFANPIYEQALRDLRHHEDAEINNGQEAFEYFSSGGDETTKNDPWNNVSLETPPEHQHNHLK